MSGPKYVGTATIPVYNGITACAKGVFEPTVDLDFGSEPIKWLAPAPSGSPTLQELLGDKSLSLLFDLDIAISGSQDYGTSKNGSVPLTDVIIIGSDNNNYVMTIGAPGGSYNQSGRFSYCGSPGAYKTSCQLSQNSSCSNNNCYQLQPTGGNSGSVYTYCQLNTNTTPWINLPVYPVKINVITYNNCLNNNIVNSTCNTVECNCYGATNYDLTLTLTINVWPAGQNVPPSPGSHPATPSSTPTNVTKIILGIMVIIATLLILAAIGYGIYRLTRKE